MAGFTFVFTQNNATKVIYDNEILPFPAINKISFFKIFESLESLTQDPDPNVSGYANNLLRDLAPYPELREGFTDKSLLIKYEKEIHQLLRVIFPDVLLENEIKAIAAPFDFHPFYFSTRFKNIIEAAGPGFTLEYAGLNKDDFYVIGCLMILGSHYKFPVDISQPVTLAIPNQQTKSTRQYRVAFNADLLEVVPPANVPEFTMEDYMELINNMDNLALWKEKFPPDTWEMRGIGVMNLTDVTMDHSIGQITSALFEKNGDLMARMERSMRSLFNIHDLSVSFVHFADNAFQQTHKNNIKSFLLGDMESCSPAEALCDESSDKLFARKEPLVITDVSAFHEVVPDSRLTQNLLDQGINSYIIAPLSYDDQTIGFLEIASQHVHQLSPLSLKKLEHVLPVLSIAAARFSEESKNRLDAIIQEECTTIHSSVKWRFEQEARKFMEDQYSGRVPVFKDLVFKNVFPLYGQMDIRQSSTLRNNAVRADLTQQLNQVKKILHKAYTKQNLPSLEELTYRVDQYLAEIAEDLLAGSEHKILAFLTSDIYPVFNHLKQTDSKLEKEIDTYRNLLDPETQMVYDKRKDFDESVNKINRTLAGYIDKKQLEAQQMFPHYFERYKTDGVEFNMYIGQSLVKDQIFDKLYVSNLRIWQLMVMCEMENEFHHIQQDLGHTLEIASMILAHSNPLSIHFRLDEKRFDIEGAYNARYEVVKKRVDKALIKGTDERVTAPGKIAIVYSNEEDAIEYGKYLDFLIAKGYIEAESVEDLELENLQGITGLRALRASVVYDSGRLSDESVALDELIDSISSESVGRN